MAMPASDARLSRTSRSKSKVRPASTERQLAPARIMVSTVRYTDDGNVKAHVLVGLGDFDHGKPARSSVEALVIERLHEPPGSLDRRIGAFHGFNGDAGLRGNHNGLANVEAGNGAGNAHAVFNVLALLFVGARAR